jgi:hypothetical protein
MGLCRTDARNGSSGFGASHAAGLTRRTLTERWSRSWAAAATSSSFVAVCGADDEHVGVMRNGARFTAIPRCP